MKVNLGIELSDEQRALFNNALCKKGRVSRKEVRSWVEEALERLLTTQEINNEPDTPEPDSHADASVEEAAAEQSEYGRGQRIPQFVPSRGDEPYLYQPKDPELAAACSAVLDGLERIEEHAWATLEGNRK